MDAKTGDGGQMGLQRLPDETLGLDQVHIFLPVGFDDGTLPLPEPPHEKLGPVNPGSGHNQRGHTHFVHIHPASCRLYGRQGWELQSAPERFDRSWGHIRSPLALDPRSQGYVALP